MYVSIRSRVSCEVLPVLMRTMAIDEKLLERLLWTRACSARFWHGSFLSALAVPGTKAMAPNANTKPVDAITRRFKTFTPSCTWGDWRHRDGGVTPDGVARFAFDAFAFAAGARRGGLTRWGGQPNGAMTPTTDRASRR